MPGSEPFFGVPGFKVGRSLRFTDDDGPELTRTYTAAGNRKTWTWSSWIKRGNLSAEASSQYDYHNIFYRVSFLLSNYNSITSALPSFFVGATSMSEDNPLGSESLVTTMFIS